MEDGQGVLVGWTSHDLGSKLALDLQYVTKPPPHGTDDIHRHVLLLNRNQAAQLGFFLFRVTGQTPPESPKGGFLRRLFKR